MRRGKLGRAVQTCGSRRVGRAEEIAAGVGLWKGPRGLPGNIIIRNTVALQVHTDITYALLLFLQNIGVTKYTLKERSAAVVQHRCSSLKANCN
jgi:hypothetical protein